MAKSDATESPTMRPFLVTIRSKQHGTIRYATWALSTEGAKWNVLAVEDCPPDIVTVCEA